MNKVYNAKVITSMMFRGISGALYLEKRALLDEDSDVTGFPG
jgi:hypothetical protein